MVRVVQYCSVCRALRQAGIGLRSSSMGCDELYDLYVRAIETHTPLWAECESTAWPARTLEGPAEEA